MLQYEDTQHLKQYSNRTFMELKFLVEYIVTILPINSNRTFMELKYKTHSYEGYNQRDSNRTFMELKLGGELGGNKKSVTPIAPLWN